MTDVPNKRFWALTLASVGVVFGDIGTSPLYAMREALAHVKGVAGEAAVLGVVSLVLWALILVVTIKYLVLVMRADNGGEGGTLSLMALAQQALGRRSTFIFVLGVAGAALFYADGLITPAISVPASFQKSKLAGGGARGDTDVVLDAAEIINFTMREIPHSIRRLVEYAGCGVADVDAYVFHQANQFINNQVARKIGIKSDKAPTSLYDFGNTSSATIPLTITTQLRERLAESPQKLVMSGFGVGLSWTSAYWDAERVHLPELVEV